MNLYLKYGGAFLIGLFLLFSCSPKVTGPMFNETPPNGILVKENFYCDQTEATNFNWLEYMYWTERIYGKNSLEHMAVHPDTNVWLVDTNFRSYPGYYLRHPAYRDYPVVGVTREQALDYSVWRSDRVFEFLLIREGVIQRDTAQTRESHFTIKNYFDGKYNGYSPETYIEFYPEFRLPTDEERFTIIHYADSVKTAYLDNCKGKKCKECREYDYFSLLNIELDGGDAMIPVESGCIPNKYQYIYHLFGNAAEWVNKGILGGGSWEDELSDLEKMYEYPKKTPTDYFIFTDQPSRTSGFRNVFEWKSVDSLKLN